MPRYHFHMASGAFCCRDEHGLEHADLAAAHRHALRLAHRVIRDVARLGAGERWIVRVGSTADDPELIVLFPVENLRLPGVVAESPPGAAATFSQRLP